MLLIVKPQWVELNISAQVSQVKYTQQTAIGIHLNYRKLDET